MPLKAELDCSGISQPQRVEPTLQSMINLFKLIAIIRERGNWPFIRRNHGQLREFILCKNGLNRKPFCEIFPYWFYLLKGLDALVWRLETFGFLYRPGAVETEKQNLNRYL